MSRGAKVGGLIGALGLVIAIVWFITPGTRVLIGYGCEGHTRPVLGYEEDQFPRCAEIRPLD